MCSSRVLVLVLFLSVGEVRVKCDVDVAPEGSGLHRAFRMLLEHSLDVFAPVSTAFHNPLCRNHSLLYREGVRLNTQWALTMLDASAKLPSGLLTGNAIQMGSYDACVDLEDIATEHGSFSGRHCMVNIGGRGFLSELSVRGQLIYGLGSMRFPQRAGQAGAYTLPEEMGATWSVCIPSSCGPRDLELHLRSTLSHVLGNTTSIRVHELACNSRADPSPEPTLAEWLSWAFLGLLIVLILGSTIVDLVTHPVPGSNPGRRLLLCSFSLRANWRGLVGVGAAPNPNNITALEGVRVLTTLWVVLAHAYAVGMYPAAINLAHAQEMAADWWHILLANGSLSVDVFFLMSGALLCYNFLHERAKRVPFDPRRYYLHRYIRIFPVYYAVFLCIVMVRPNLDVGPLYKSNVETVQDSCRNTGWWGLLFLGNYLDTERGCMGVDWYLSADMQLFWISPLLLFPLWRKPTAGKLLLGALTVLATGGVYWYSFAYSVAVTSFMNQRLGTTHETDALTNQFFYTHLRCTSWLLGISLGYLLHVTRHASVRLPRGVATVAWAASGALIGATLYCSHSFMQPDYRFDRVWTAVFTALNRPAFSLGLAWVIFACARGYGGFVVTALSWRGFQVLSRLCYAVYLVHSPVLLYYHLGSHKAVKHFNDVTMLVENIGITVLSFLGSLVLYLVVEMPAVTLEKAFLAFWRETCSSAHVDDAVIRLSHMKKNEDEEGQG